ncbi:hypothetical protein FB451DRAFT_1180508 [Mycena latifolia]|nr:hypothetical protein FB451DRAFT_1180508 [Mycena latifolia]
MVNFLHNVTALAGAFTLTRIFDFQGHVVTLSTNQVFEGAAVWFIDPLPANDGTFIVENFLGPFLSAADAGQGNGDHSPAVASPSSNVGLATVFKMQTVGSGPQVNFIQALGSDTYALTAWSNPDPARTDPTTPITMERLMVPNSFMQTFTIQLATQPQNGAAKDRIHYPRARTGPILGKQVHTNLPDPPSKSEPIPPNIPLVPSRLRPDPLVFYTMQAGLLSTSGCAHLEHNRRLLRSTGDARDRIDTDGPKDFLPSLGDSHRQTASETSRTYRYFTALKNEIMGMDLHIRHRKWEWKRGGLGGEGTWAAVGSAYNVGEGKVKLHRCHDYAHYFACSGTGLTSQFFKVHSPFWATEDFNNALGRWAERDGSDKINN